MKPLPTTAAATIILAIASTALSGCAGVPLSTMWHFRDFGPQNLVETDPAQVKAALRTWSGVDLNGGPPELHITFQFEGEQSQRYEMPMSLLTDNAATQQLPDPGKGLEWYVFALSPAGVKSFRDMQQMLKDHMDASGKIRPHGTLNVVISTDKMQMSPTVMGRIQNEKALPLQIRLQLSPAEGYYTMYEGEIPVKPQAAATASGRHLNVLFKQTTRQP